MSTIPLRASIMAALSAAALCPGAVQAAAVVLWPVDPVIQKGQSASALWVENKGTAPVTLQVRTLGWSQDKGEESYDQQDDVVASPPIATVAGGQRQLIRIIRRDTGGATSENSYRLLIDELPPPVSADKAAAPNAQLSVQMRYSVPLFTYSADQTQPTLSARFEVHDGRRFVVISNSGTQHARLVDLRMRAGGTPTTILSGLVGYVLPGSTMRWALPANAPLVQQILVNVNGSDVSLSTSI